jgi:hypothetical protein
MTTSVLDQPQTIDLRIVRIFGLQDPNPIRGAVGLICISSLESFDFFVPL